MGVFMKKYLFLLIAVISFLLSSCTEKTKPNIELETYDLSHATFESFYQIQTSIITDENQSTFRITLSPKYVFNVIESSVKIRIYYDFIYESLLVNGFFEETIVLDGTLQTIDKIIDYGSSYSILGYVVFDASGQITSDVTLSISSKTYIEPFDKETAFTNQIELFLELQNRIKDLEIDQHQHITKTTTQVTTFDMGGETEVMTDVIIEQMILEPFYYRLFASEHEMIVNQNEDAIYMFTWSGFSKAYQKLMYLDLIDLDEFNPNDFFNIEEIVIDSNMNFEKVSISKQDNHYSIEGFLKDLISFEEYQELKSLYQMLGVSLTVLESITIKYTFKFDAEFEVTSNFEIDLVDLELSIIMMSVETYAFGVFEPIDPITNSSYLIIHPDSIDRVYNDTNLLAVVSGGGIGESHFYRGYLEKGVYEIDKFDGLFEYHLYDQDGNFLTHAIPDPYFSSNLFEIEKDGYYYISINRLSYLMPDYQFKLTKTNLVDFINPKIDLTTEGEKTFSVESNEDLIRFEYYTDQRQVLKITIEADQFLQFHYPYVNGQLMVSSSRITTIGVEPGVYQFYISSDFMASGTLSVEVIDLPNIYSISTTEYEVSENFFDQVIYYGGLLGDVYFNLNVIDSGVYRFEMWFNSIAVYEKIGSDYHIIRSLSGMQPIYLEAGNYYLKANASFLSQGNIKYHKESLEYQSTNLVLNRYVYHLNVLNDLEEYETILLHINHTHTYYFTLENNEYILFNGSNTYLRNAENEILNLHRSDPNFGYNNLDIYYLEAGTYSITQTNFINGERTWEIKIGIIDYLPSDDNPNHEPLEMINGGATMLIKNHPYDHELIKIVITEAGLYRFTSSRQFELYQNMDYIGSYKDIDMNMQVGTYYVFINTSLLGLSLSILFGYTKIE
jgi:hypothetical protein